MKDRSSGRLHCSSHQLSCIPSNKHKFERSNDGFGRQFLRRVHDKFLEKRDSWLESDSNRTVRSRECFSPYNNLIDCCAHACPHHKPINATPSKLGGACGFVSICSLAAVVVLVALQRRRKDGFPPSLSAPHPGLVTAVRW